MLSIAIRQGWFCCGTGPVIIAIPLLSLTDQASETTNPTAPISRTESAVIGEFAIFDRIRKRFPEPLGANAKFKSIERSSPGAAKASFPLYRELRGLMLKTAGLVDILAEALKPLADKVRLAFVYGSIASGEERSDSDVDLMIIGSASAAELALPLRRARETPGQQ